MPTIAHYQRRGSAPVITKQQQLSRKRPFLFHTQISRFIKKKKKVFARITRGCSPGEKPQSGPVSRMDNLRAAPPGRIFAPSAPQGLSSWDSLRRPEVKAIRLITVPRRPAVLPMHSPRQGCPGWRVVTSVKHLGQPGFAVDCAPPLAPAGRGLDLLRG